jgi:hypothetical protein
LLNHPQRLFSCQRIYLRKNCRHGFEYTATVDCETFQLTGPFRSGLIVSPFHSGGRYEEVITNERFLLIKLIQVETREFLYLEACL